MNPNTLAILHLMANSNPKLGITPDMIAMSARNIPEKKTNYNTPLTADEEKSFNEWYSKVSKYKGLSPNPDSEGQDYDYRGYWKNEDREGILGSNPNAHFIDKYKKPGHPTFSTESKYSSEETPGGEWSQDENGTWYFNHSPYTAKNIAKTQQYLRGTGEYSINPQTGEVLTDINKDVVSPIGPINNIDFSASPEMSDSEMKSKIAIAAAMGNKSAQRMTQVSPPTYTFTGNERDAYFDQPIGVPQGESGTHFMASMGNYAVPFIQQGQNGLYFNESANPSNAEAIKFMTPEQAMYFSENYKRVAPMTRKQ
jgi:hypothetical protein